MSIAWYSMPVLGRFLPLWGRLSRRPLFFLQSIAGNTVADASVGLQWPSSPSPDLTSIHHVRPARSRLRHRSRLGVIISADGSAAHLVRLTGSTPYASFPYLKVLCRVVDLAPDRCAYNWSTMRWKRCYAKRGSSFGDSLPSLSSVTTQVRLDWRSEVSRAKITIPT
jgi:hypothetical protein